MFKIGDFAKIAGVPTSQLRYYDEIGLFSPRQSDVQTRYRYYSIEQLTDLYRILALKELGLALDKIQIFIHDNISNDEIRGMFLLRKADLEQQIRDDIVRLQRVDYLLHQLENPRWLQDDEPISTIHEQVQAMLVQVVEALPDTSR